MDDVSIPKYLNNLCYNKSMRKRSFGFTLIEISFFIAITGLLFVGIIIGTQNSLWQQKYNDSVQSFTNFIRNAYSSVSNTQNIGDGRSDKAIYGKLISFGQTHKIDGSLIPEGEQMIYIYDVIGDATGSRTGSVNETLIALKASVVVEERNEFDNTVKVGLAGIAESYTPIWGSVVESTTPKDLYENAILIVKHPRSGTINTLVSSDHRLHAINEWLNGDSDQKEKLGQLMIEVLDPENENSFKIEEIDLCLNPYGFNETGTMRRDVRLIKNARNASGVEIINTNTGDDKCN